MADLKGQQEQERLRAEEAERQRQTAIQPASRARPAASKDPEQTEAEARQTLANRAAGAETKPVGVTIRGGKPGPDGKHYGGEVVDHDGNVLATFDPKQVNTGNPDDGTKPK